VSEPGISAAQTTSGFRVRELPLAPRNDDTILVIAGLDPAIHPKAVDARVSPRMTWSRGAAAFRHK
jgi:hypothetical protein